MSRYAKTLMKLFLFILLSSFDYGMSSCHVCFGNHYIFGNLTLLIQKNLLDLTFVRCQDNQYQ